MNLFDLTERKAKRHSVNEGIEIVYEKIDEDYASMGRGGGAGVANGGGGGAAGETSPRNNHSVIGSDGIEIDEHIVKVKGGYELKSKHGNKNLGKYPTRAGAEKRERQVQYFKHAGESVDVNEAQDAWHSSDEWHGEQTDEWHGGASDRWHGQGDAWHSMEEAAPDTATRLKHNLKRGGFDMDRFDAKIREIEARNRELADEFYARHPELDDRPKTVDENDLAGALTGLNGVAASQGSDNILSPIGSGTVDEGRDDEVGFGVSSEQAYNAVMAKFGDYIEHRDDGIMYAPRELWSAIEQTAFDADGVGAEEDWGIAEDQHSDFESKDSIRVWENIDDRLDMEEKMSIFESWSRGQLNESADEHKLEYFRSLEHYSSNPVVGKTYIVVPLALSHQLRALSVPEKCKYLGFKNHMHLVENQVGDVKKYPYAPFRPNSSFICFFFDSINKYNQFRSSILVKFNLSLNDINEELNAGGSNQEPASNSTSPVGGGGASVEESKESEITEDIYESRIYRMKLAGYFE